ncbi:Uncharacterised protein [Mycobacteroides abscessus subsp. abscessus]|nr:Uncharacterised protein [Mycobacteroides abscessus subsp. abscessus]
MSGATVTLLLLIGGVMGALIAWNPKNGDTP